MSNFEIQEKITKVENLLKHELLTITQLKDSTEENKKYLMDTLETLSNNFHTDCIIEEANLLPQLFKSLNDTLTKVNSNLLIMKDLENNINSILFAISMQLSNDALNIDDLNNQLNLYNLKKMETKTDILNNTTYVQKFIESSRPIVDTLTDNIKNSKEYIIKEFKAKRNEIKTDTTEVENVLYKPYKIQENDTLLISEKQEKIYLPYTLSDLAQYTQDTDKSLEDVVRENFVISLKSFKNPTISRFKEAYNLAKNKSNCSNFKSFNFAMEVIFKRSLNPAIIVACKNTGELKDYLSCLKEENLDLFKPFKIKYEMNPMKISKINTTLF